LVTGFTVKGKVLSYTNAMPNVNVYLYKAGDKAKNALKSDESDSEGAYAF
jgi:hypothetical protein